MSEVCSKGSGVHSSRRAPIYGLERLKGYATDHSNFDPWNLFVYGRFRLRHRGTEIARSAYRA